MPPELSHEEILYYLYYLLIPEVGLVVHKRVKNLKGGINAWVREVNSNLPVY